MDSPPADQDVQAVIEEPATTATEMTGTGLADDVIHLTYLSQRAGRPALRSSIWLRTPDGWRVYFHQGTLIGG